MGHERVRRHEDASAAPEAAASAASGAGRPVQLARDARLTSMRASLQSRFHPLPGARIEGALPGEGEQGGTEVTPEPEQGTDGTSEAPIPAETRSPPSTGAVAISVPVTIPATTFDHSHTARQIAELRQGGSGGQENAGLTQARKTMGMTVTHDGREAGGRYEYWLTAVTVRLAFEHMSVYIASEYAEGSCEYDATRRHELEHVACNCSTLREHAAAMEAALRAASLPTQASPLVADTESAADAQAGRALMDILRPMNTALGTALRVANTALDTPENYAQVHGQCTAW